MEHRAAIYTSTRLPDKDYDDPEWQSLYAERLHYLELLAMIEEAVKEGDLPDFLPDNYRKGTQFGNVLGRSISTVTVIHPQKLLLQLHNSRITHETIQALADWIGIQPPQ